MGLIIRESAPTVQFKLSVAANIVYWQRRTADHSPESLRGLEPEWRNLFRAAEFGMGLLDTWRETSELLLDLRDLFDQGIFWIEWAPLMEDVIARCTESDRRLNCRLLNLLGFLYRRNRKLERSLALHLEALKLASLVQEERLLARSHLELSRTYLGLRRYDESDDHALRALAGYERLGGDARMLGSCLLNIGLSAHGRGQMEKAESYLRRSVDLFLTTEDSLNLARVCLNLAITLDACGKSDEALAYYLQAESLLAESGSELDKANVQLSLGTLYFRQGKLELAEAAYRQGNSPYLRQSTHHWHRALAANNLGNVYLATDRLDEAERWLLAAIRLWRKASAGLMLANTLGDLARVKVGLGQPTEAFPLYDEAIDITEDYPDDAWGRSMNAKFVGARSALVDRQ